MTQQVESNVPAFMSDRRRAAEPVPIRVRSGRARGLTVACILDEFSFHSFGPEADFVALTMRDWRAELTAAQPDLLLVESAWRGHRETWWNTVSRYGPELQGILAWCHERGVPTAFWNKEDPVHFGTFLNVASRFDVVFTTDLDCVPRYKAQLGHERVHFLPFAAQPASHNPIELFDRIEGCAFAGAYYKKYPHRNRALEEISAAVAEVGRFDIYDRNFSKPHPDHTFPERFQSLIVGGLLPQEIDVAYKGYTTNLNLNSVQASQSMFARRVFELLASNTLVISNFARGLRLMFGDLVVTVSGAVEIRRRFEVLENTTNGRERLRNQALRKVMSQHTYSERLAYVAEVCGLPLEPVDSVVPVIVARVHDDAERNRLEAMARVQDHRRWHLVLWGDGARELALPGVQISLARSEASALDLVRGLGATHVGVWDLDDWYGPGYISDLADTLQWADVAGAGHVERWVNASGALVRRDGGAAWSLQAEIPLSRGIVDIERITSLSGSHFKGLAVSTLDYCEAGARLGAAPLAPASRLDLDEGLSLSEMRAHADALPAEGPSHDASLELPLKVLLGGVESKNRIQVEETGDGTYRVAAELAAGTHQYLYSSQTLDLDVLPSGAQSAGHFTATPGLDLMLVIVYLDEDLKKISHVMMPNGKNVDFRAPERTRYVRVGIRASGTGETRIERYVRGPLRAAPKPIVLRSQNLIVTNIYPSYEQLYRNGFVASRVRSYTEAGFDVDIALVDARADSPEFREFRDVDVARLSPSALSLTVNQPGVRRILVHFLDRNIWDCLRAAPRDVQVTVWVHGFEVQPWHRRAFQHTSPEDLASAQERSDERMTMWREIFSEPPPGWHFVFVSDYLAEQAFEDIGMRLPENAFSIIHNPIDTELFSFREKQPDARYRVLSVRPYASSVYANDLAVAAVLRLQQTRSDFDQFQFAFYGDGPLFEEVTRPLKDLDNVSLNRRFLTQEEIAALHREYGVFLTPSRMDTQGVSRGEAMASGLVPIASAVAAVPEFVDADSGILVPGEDADELAAAMGRLADDPELFLRLSRGAASRIHEQVASNIVIAKEIALALRE